MFRQTSRVLPVLVALAFVACDAQDPFEIPTSASPPPIITETFNGTVTPSGARSHSFATQASGSVTATLKFLVPDPTVQMGFALGTWNGSTCNLIITKTDAVESTVITGAVSALGNLCVYIHDVGNLTAPTEYEIEVLHP
ncbi:MAG TPA: hypothetical protein VMO26_29240 [Vicinamibacterales bacterium]|nr:hypothetical protein [Vicinamibacterales bacterium]